MRNLLMMPSETEYKALCCIRENCERDGWVAWSDLRRAWVGIPIKEGYPVMISANSMDAMHHKGLIETKKIKNHRYYKVSSLGELLFDFMAAAQEDPNNPRNKENES